MRGRAGCRALWARVRKEKQSTWGCCARVSGSACQLHAGRPATAKGPCKAGASRAHAFEGSNNEFSVRRLCLAAHDAQVQVTITRAGAVDTPSLGEGAAPHPITCPKLRRAATAHRKAATADARPELCSSHVPPLSQGLARVCPYTHPAHECVPRQAHQHGYPSCAGGGARWSRGPAQRLPDAAARRSRHACVHMGRTLRCQATHRSQQRSRGAARAGPTGSLQAPAALATKDTCAHGRPGPHLHWPSALAAAPRPPHHGWRLRASGAARSRRQARPAAGHTAEGLGDMGRDPSGCWRDLPTQACGNSTCQQCREACLWGQGAGKGGLGAGGSLRAASRACATAMGRWAAPRSRRAAWTGV
jgi:hypothetical protein